MMMKKHELTPVCLAVRTAITMVAQGWADWRGNAVRVTNASSNEGRLPAIAERLSPLRPAVDQ